MADETTNKKTESERQPDFSLEIYSIFSIGITHPHLKRDRGPENSSLTSIQLQKTENTSDSARRFRGVI
jgi:hypothetical protein